MSRGRAGAAAALALAALLPGVAQAQSVLDCDRWQANARNLMLPPAAHSRSYANDQVHLLGLDTGEPACCSVYLMVLWPASEGEYLECALIAREGELGFAFAEIAQTAAGYDPATGLRLEVPVTIYLPEASFTNSGIVGLTVNRATATVTADFTPGPNE